MRPSVSIFSFLKLGVLQERQMCRVFLICKFDSTHALETLHRQTTLVVSSQNSLTSLSKRRPNFLSAPLVCPQKMSSTNYTNTEFWSWTWVLQFRLLVLCLNAVHAYRWLVTPRYIYLQTSLLFLTLIQHVPKALEQGVDLICAQAGEGGGHTGDIPGTMLIPACVDAVKGHKSPLTGEPVYVIGAGAVYDGRGLAANLMYVWCILSWK